MSSKRKRSAAIKEVNEVESDGHFESEDEYGRPSEDELVAPQSECPFSVDYRPAKRTLPRGKKAKRHKADNSDVSGPPPKQELDKTPPEDLAHIIRPKKNWDQLKKYRNFVVGTESFSLGEYIFVNHNNIAQGVELAATDDESFWVAKVLEIRAVDEAHVYLRVYWFYWPKELPEGRQPYHGRGELIASNHMQVIDAMTVSGRANVKQWMELDEEEILPDLFWRQKFDYLTQTLTEVREHCKCHQYYNPDNRMFGCSHCKIWLHEECIIEDIRQKVYNRLVNPSASTTASKGPAKVPKSGVETASTVLAPIKRGRKSLLTTNSVTTTSANGKTATTTGKALKKSSAKLVKAKKNEAQEMFAVEIVPSDTEPTKAKIMDLRETKEEGDDVWEETVYCLVCHEIMS